MKAVDELNHLLEELVDCAAAFDGLEDIISRCSETEEISGQSIYFLLKPLTQKNREVIRRLQAL
jgi:hypothetical protein